MSAEGYELTGKVDRLSKGGEALEAHSADNCHTIEHVKSTLQEVPLRFNAFPLTTILRRTWQ